MCSLVNSDSCDLHPKSILVGGSISRNLMEKKNSSQKSSAIGDVA